MILYCGHERSIFYNEISHLSYEISAFSRAVISASSCFERKVLGNWTKHLLSCLYEGVFCLYHGLCFDFIFNQDKYIIRQVRIHLLLILVARVQCSYLCLIESLALTRLFCLCRWQHLAQTLSFHQPVNTHVCNVVAASQDYTSCVSRSRTQGLLPFPV